ncbi:ATP-binding protein [Coralliovum pocilloporae]|uniref:ATP-binding protein n=1 Tax=Coralliovum pocilloporae TaxID=3066369 RepID=UPI003307A9E2
MRERLIHKGTGPDSAERPSPPPVFARPASKTLRRRKTSYPSRQTRAVVLLCAGLANLGIALLFVLLGHYGFALVPSAFGSLCLGLLLGTPDGSGQQRLFKTSTSLSSNGSALAVRASADQSEQLQDEIWELRDTLQHYRALIDQSGDVVLERDSNDRITYMNPSASRLLAGNPHIRIGNTLDLDHLTESYNTISVNGEGDIDLQLQTVSGPCWFSWRDITIRDEANRVTSTLTLAQDISNRKAHETALTDAKIAAEDANSAKSRFLATVSHEIRTPLNGILGMTGLLMDTELSPEQRNYADIAQSSGLALLELINDLLDISRIEAGRLDLSSEPTDIRDLVEKLAELFAPKAYAKSLDLAIQLDPALPSNIMLDGSRLRQVLLNLIGNAVKFTETGGVRVSISSEPDKEDGHYHLTFSVEDTGPGIAVEPVEAVFDEFTQADEGPTRLHGGSGLGLSISQRIVHLMGSHIDVETGTSGSRFHFVLSVKADPASVTESSSDPGHCLIIWDSPLEAPALKTDLEALGHHVTIASDLKDIRFDDKFKPDLLLYADTGEQNPETVSTRFREISLPDIPRAVILTHDGRNRLNDWQAQGLDAFLVRPIRSATLKRLLDQLLDPDDHTTPLDKAPETILDTDADKPAPVSALKVLVVEDNDVNALLVTTLLQKTGHRPARVADGDAGIMAARERTYDLILMDLHMPRVDGRSALRQIREDEQELGRAPVPVVALTADVLAEDGQNPDDLQFDGFITKPIDPERLQSLLADIASR